MPSLQEIKNRINAVGITRKITKAMQLVATSKLTRAKKNLQSIQEYYTSVFDTFEDLLTNVKDVNSLFPNNAKKHTLHIVITSDIGLCGGYNSNIFKQVKKYFNINDGFMVIGIKGVYYFKSKGLHLYKAYTHISDNLNYDYSFELSRQALSSFYAGDFNKVKIHYTKFINSVTFTPTELQLLPIEKNEDESSNKILNNGITEFEPSADVVLKNSIPLYVSAMIYGCMTESKVSEHSSRRTAMENATENADDLIQQLNLKYNRARQAAITQEISEIVAGIDV